MVGDDVTGTKTFLITMIGVLVYVGLCFYMVGHPDFIIGRFILECTTAVLLTLWVLRIYWLSRNNGETLCTEENKKKFKVRRKSKTYGKFIIVPRYIGLNPDLTTTYCYGTDIKDAIEAVIDGKGDFVLDLSAGTDIPGEPQYTNILKSRIQFPFLFLGELVDREKGEELRKEIVANWKDVQFEYHIVCRQYDRVGEIRPSHLLSYVVTADEQIGFYNDCTPMSFQDAKEAQNYAEQLRQRLITEATAYILTKEIISIAPGSAFESLEKRKQKRLLEAKEYLSKQSSINLSDEKTAPVRDIAVWWLKVMCCDIEKFSNSDYFNVAVVQTVK